MKVYVVNSINEAMFTTDLSNSAVVYLSSKAVLRYFGKDANNTLPMSDGYAVNYNDFKEMMDQMYF